MEDFCQLFRLLDASTATEAKIQALVTFFQNASPADAAWALHVLLGRQKRRLITGRRLRDICLEVAPWPPWLFNACYRQVGDSAETISLLWRPNPGLPTLGAADGPLRGSLQEWMERRLPALAALQGAAQAEAVRTCWQGLWGDQLLVVNKVLTGGLRVGVSEGLVIRALARLSGLEEATLKHRCMGKVSPSAAAWEALLQPTEADTVPPSRPYPFFLASPLERSVVESTPAHQWQVEWKYDGMRCQLIHRQGEVFLWSRGEDLLNPGFPELTAAAAQLPEGLVLDGEVVIWAPEEPHPRSFAALQRRLGRLAPERQQLRQLPACFVIYDLLEHSGEDQRAQPLLERRRQLEVLQEAGLPAPLRLAPLLPLDHWPALEALREGARLAGAEGVMLKKRDSPYLSGRRRGHWWKHKLEPFRLDAVLLYAQPGSGRRANLLTDYTFALWDRPWREGEGEGQGESGADEGKSGEGQSESGEGQGDSSEGEGEGGEGEGEGKSGQGEGGEGQGQGVSGEGAPRLVTFAKAYSGLDDKEILRLDQWIRRHTLQRFGPVRAVEPQLVFELAFEGLQPSPRHKSGLAVRFPRICRWRTDKQARQADSLVEALALMALPAEIAPSR